MPPPRGTLSFSLVVLSGRSWKKRDGTVNLVTEKLQKGKYRVYKFITGSTVPYNEQQGNAFSILNPEGNQGKRFTELWEKQPCEGL